MPFVIFRSKVLRVRLSQSTSTRPVSIGSSPEVPTRVESRNNATTVTKQTESVATVRGTKAGPGTATPMMTSRGMDCAPPTPQPRTTPDRATALRRGATAAAVNPTDQLVATGTATMTVALRPTPDTSHAGPNFPISRTKPTAAGTVDATQVPRGGGGTALGAPNGGTVAGTRGPGAILRRADADNDVLG